MGLGIFPKSFLIGLTSLTRYVKFGAQIENPLFVKTTGGKDKEHYYRWIDRVTTNSNALRMLVSS